MSVKDWLKQEAPGWAQNLPGGKKSKVPSVKVFTTALTKAPVLDQAKNVKSPGLRMVASLGEGIVNTPSNIVRSYGRTFNDIGNRASVKKTLGDAGELALNMASFLPAGKAANLAKQGFRQGAARAPQVYPLVREGIKYGAKSGALYGAGYGATQAMQNDERIAKILQDAAVSGGTGLVFGGLAGGLSAGAPAIYNAFKNRKALPEVIPRHEVPVGTFNTGLETLKSDQLRRQGYDVNVVHGVGKGKSAVSMVIPEQVQSGRTRLDDVIGQVQSAFPRPGMSIQAVDDPLLQEARKYKSAEEFVKAQAKKDYVLEVRKTTVNDIAKVGTYGEAGSAKTSARRKLASDITDKEIEIAQRDQKLFDTNKNKTIEQLQNEITETKKWADENNTSYPRSIQVKEEIIKTKSQLTDLWNKAQGGKERLNDVISQVVDAFPTPGMSLMDVNRKQRGFAETVARSPLTSEKTSSMLTDASYVPQGNDELVKYASGMIRARKISQAKDIALNGNDNRSLAVGSELIKHYQRVGDDDAAVELTKALAEKLTKAGQYVQAASLYNKLTPEGILLYANKELGKSGLELTGEEGKMLSDMARQAGKMKGEEQVIATQQMLRKVQELVPSPFVDQLITVWKAGLLTNPTTHLANVGGNATMLGLETAKDYPAAVLDSMASIVTGKRTKAAPSYRAIGSGMVSGAKKAYTYAKTGVDVDQTLGKIDYKHVNLPPVIKQYTEAVFRTLGTTDKLFKETLLKKSLMEQAKVDGMNRGLSGKALRDHANTLFNSPTVDMVKNATEEALYGTFNSDNAFASRIGNSAVANIIAPFKRTPANVAARILDYSPYGVGKGIVNAFQGNQKGFAENVSRGLIGTGIGAVGYGLGKAGMMTGNYPSNETERALWEAEGRQPGALKVGDSYYGLNRISPVGNILATGAGMADLGRIKPENVPGAMAAVAGKNLLGQTYLQGVSGALNALQDPNRSASTWAENMAKGVIPSVVGAGARFVDPYQRQVNSIGEAVQSRIPGLSQNLLPKVDVFGQKLKNESNPFFDPFNTKKDKSDATTKEIWRLYKNYAGVSLGKPNETVSLGKGLKIDLTPEEFTAYQQRSGGVFKPMLDKIISSKEYREMSDYDKSKTINNVISKVRQLWVVQNAPQLENKGMILNQIQDQARLRTPAVFGR